MSWPSSDDLQRQAAEAAAARERARQEREAEETRKAVAEARFEVCGMLNPVAVDVLPERAQSVCEIDASSEGVYAPTKTPASVRRLPLPADPAVAVGAAGIEPATPRV